MNEQLDITQTNLLESQLKQTWSHSEINSLGCPVSSFQHCGDCQKHGSQCRIKIYDQKNQKHTYEHFKQIMLLERLKFNENKQ